MLIDINPEFKKANEILAKTKKNLFLTGKAGTGKSTFLKYFTEKTKKNFAILAPTGVAALNVGGETIHSFFRFPTHVTETDVVSKAKSFRGDSVYHHIDMIIIDEISMVRADLLDYIDLFLRTALAKKQPFGGIQMLFIGDLYQLPPVVTAEEKGLFSSVDYASQYFFDAKVMKDGKFELEYVELEKIYRQSEKKFIDILNAIRNKTIEDKHLEELNKRVDEKFDDSSYITLTTVNADADKINKYELAKLKTKGKTYVANVTGDFKQSTYPTEVELTIKPDAKIMFLNNDSEGRWVNGTIGFVRKVSDKSVIVETDDGEFHEVEPHTWKVKRYVYDKKSRSLSQEDIGSFKQFPFRLAWAITIHKSQGKTFDKVIIDMGRGSFVHGQTYVALSRSRTLNGIVLKKPMKKSHLILDYRVMKFITGIQYSKSDVDMSFDDKVNFLEKAMREDKVVEILYLKAQDVKSRRCIKINSVQEEEYMGKSFLGVQAFCMTRKEDRIFRVDRILEMKVVE